MVSGLSQYIVGISGGIGSGKTTVTDLFAKYGIDVIDADIIARQVVEPGSKGLAAIVDKFGGSILDASGQLERSKLRKLVFDNPDIKSWLNQLLHPAIRQLMVTQCQQADSAYCLLSVPLLVENKLYEMVDTVLIVDVEEATQLSRTILRDNSNERQIRAIMQSQASRQARLAVADNVIDNNGETSLLNRQVEALHRQYLTMAQQKHAGRSE